MTTETALAQQVALLTKAVEAMAQNLGTRLSTAQLCARMGIHRNTLAKRRLEPGFPKPDLSGKWLLSEIIQWEQLH
jgi:predicted DNA-binding transcriptional regulator AlpA